MENVQTVSKRNLPRDVFLHFLAIITLYWSAVSFITLLFQYVNYFLPDPFMAGNDYYLGPIRFAVSSLIIVFPVFIIISWFLNKIYIKEPRLREMKLRKWLIYFTLFVAALVIIGDLVRTVLYYLEGGITLQFVLKALSILFVACVIFGYYLNDVRRISPSKTVKYFVWLVCIVVSISVIGAFFIIGSPKEARLKQFDQEKISDLQDIQFRIINYWQKKQKLPEKLSDLSDPISGFVAPADRQTGVSYEYNIKGDLEFELCAVFNRPWDFQQMRIASIPVQEPYFSEYSQNWDHSEGRFCFDREIDKELYLLKKD
ncbi:hypothetical protein KKC00_02965 [Patescibacteria group bacterium]|nr:hypothetical protein [Patescibacteria group bacterium]